MFVDFTQLLYEDVEFRYIIDRILSELENYLLLQNEFSNYIKITFNNFITSEVIWNDLQYSILQSHFIYDSINPYRQKIEGITMFDINDFNFIYKNGFNGLPIMYTEYKNNKIMELLYEDDVNFPIIKNIELI